MNKKTRDRVLIVAILFLILSVSSLVRAAGCDRDKLAVVSAYQKGGAIMNLQACLIDSGFDISAGASGYYGAQTINAVKNFYASWYGAWDGTKIGPQGIANLKGGLSGQIVAGGSENFKTFSSTTDFKDYFQKAIQETGYGYGGTRDMMMTNTTVSGGMGAAESSDQAKSMPAPVAIGSSATVGRVSETNVQVAGIDEPDIVKTDGKDIYYSGSNPIYWWGFGGGISATSNVARCYDCQFSDTKVIKNLPVSEMAVESAIQKTGDLILSGDILAIFGDGGVTGYNVSDPKKPVQKWVIKPEGNTSIIGSRLRDGKIYMVTKTGIGTSDVCPIRPLSIGGEGVIIPCGGIYHPERVLPANSTFSVFVINAATGAVENKTSFAGLAGSSVIYMSSENMYITYPAYESEFSVKAGAIKEGMRDLVTAATIDQVTRLEAYDISSAAKAVELNTILENYKNGLSQDDRLKFENEMQNRMDSYRKAHIRDLDKSIVAKIALGDLKFAGSGSVPGQPLNQFSLDEYNGNLRIATTIGGSWFVRSETANDVYVLDGQMNIIGSVRDLGKTEKIYSARFIGDKGYVVTFRQTDPFYVIDLADPRNPKLAGELKIPGYSGYLHPVTEDKIIGIGMENSTVKISYFDVSNPANPVEMDKYSLNEYWSEAVNNHHAFLMDDLHKVFFMPGSNGGYVFSYVNDKLSLKKAVSDMSPKRAVYVNDYLYIIGDSKISVLNENTWEKIKEFSF